MHATHTTKNQIKHCCRCNKNVAGRWRAKSNAGQYFCHSCFQQLGGAIRLTCEHSRNASASQAHAGSPVPAHARKVVHLHDRSHLPAHTHSSSHSSPKRKHCRKCLTDVSKVWRIKNSKGEYLCDPCYMKKSVVSYEEGIPSVMDGLQTNDLAG